MLSVSRSTPTRSSRPDREEHRGRCRPPGPPRAPHPPLDRCRRPQGVRHPPHRRQPGLPGHLHPGPLQLRPHRAVRAGHQGDGQGPRARSSGPSSRRPTASAGHRPRRQPPDLGDRRRRDRPVRHHGPPTSSSSPRPRPHADPPVVERRRDARRHRHRRRPDDDRHRAQRHRVHEPAVADHHDLRRRGHDHVVRPLRVPLRQRRRPRHDRPLVGLPVGAHRLAVHDRRHRHPVHAVARHRAVVGFVRRLELGHPARPEGRSSTRR
jgi:hypothetical protein